MPPALSLLDVLPDFGSPLPRVPEHEQPAQRFDPLADTGATPPEPDIVPQLQTQADDRIAAAEAAIADRLAQQHAHELEQERQRHQEELASVRAQLAEAAGQTINNRFAELETQVVDLATRATARMLGTVLTSDLQKRSIAELERVLHAALEDRESLRIRVSGSPALWDALKTGLGERANQVDFAETDSFDLSISIGEELFETRLTEWSDTLAGLIS
ncbi:hypothetical protein AB2N04_07910 [Nitratireductor sp. GISD-1A_MAKvit]|uniref:hypothetical protein n=1 Tax=Nitratireductor sp. GISD-1A_MAKvit TaxID=3234198 RepID=UPI0034676DB8